ncbi:MAG: ABC transporter substrate-binding protein [Planctomycetes bacterium]|nr:ABC transporter substrate-binding protein [Planctomycetota bacterium]
MRQALTLLIALGAVLALSLTACKKEENSAGTSGVTDDTVKIGLFVSTTGAYATFGTDTKNGVDLAVEEINATGGIKGKKIDLKFQDTASKPEEGGSAAEKLATQENVLVAMGAVASGISLSAAPVFQRSGIPMVSPSSTNPTVTQQGDQIFRICFLDDFQGASCAVFARKDLKKEKAAILMNQDDAYSTGLAKFFKAKFEALGGTIVKEESFKKDTSEFNTQITNIKNAAPDIIFVPAYYNDVALIGKQFRSQGVDVPLLGGDGWESGKLIPNAGPGTLDGCYFGNHYSQADDREVVKNFVANYKKKYGEAPSSLAALGYDDVYVVKKAIENAGAFDRAKIREALAGLKDFEGVTGKFSIDENRNARKPISMLKIEGEKFNLVRQIQPEEVE